LLTLLLASLHPFLTHPTFVHSDILLHHMRYIAGLLLGSAIE
jgi:hypothetical protein